MIFTIGKDQMEFSEVVLRISPDDSDVVVLVVPADEERMMACEALRSLSRLHISAKNER